MEVHVEFTGKQDLDFLSAQFTVIFSQEDGFCYFCGKVFQSILDFQLILFAFAFSETEVKAVFPPMLMWFS